MKYIIALISTLVLGGCVGDFTKIRSEVPTEKYSTNLSVHLILPSGGTPPYPAVVLMHGCSGLNEYTSRGMEKHARILRSAGFATVILDSFSPRHIASACAPPQPATARYFRSFDALNTLQYLKTREDIDVDNVFLVGQSNGGSVAIYLAGGGEEFGFPSELKYTAVVAYYPWCGMAIDNLVSPLLVFGGGKDTWTPPIGCEIQQNTVTGKPMQVVIYPEALHGFAVPIQKQVYSKHVVGGNTKATNDSRERMIAFFNQYINSVD